MRPSLSQVKAPACLLHIAALHWTKGCHDQGKHSAMRHSGSSDPVATEQGRESCYWCLHWEHIRSSPELCLQPEHHSSHSDPQPEINGHHLPCGTLPHQGRSSRGQRERLAVKDEGDSDLNWPLSRAGQPLL